MIRPLRQTHRLGFVLLAILLPVVFVFAMRGAGAAVIAEKDGERVLAGDVELRKPVLIREGTELVITLPLDWNEPDVLVYGSSVAAGEELPADARLLGPLIPGRKLALPADGRNSDHIVLYSLAHQRVVLSQPLEGGA